MPETILWPAAYFSLGYFFGLSFIGFIVTVHDMRAKYKHSGGRKIFYEFLIVAQFVFLSVGALTLMPIILNNTPEEYDTSLNSILLLVAAGGAVFLSKQRVKKLCTEQSGTGCE